MCDSGVGEDVAPFLVGCGGFERDGLVLLCVELWGPESGWMDFGEWTRRERWHCFWEKGEGICNRVEDVGECVLYWLGRCWQRRKQLLYE